MLSLNLLVISLMHLTVADEVHHMGDSMASNAEDLGMVVMPVQLMSGHSVNIVYNKLITNNYQPLCLTTKETHREPRSLQLLSQQICQSQGFKTYQDYGFVAKSRLRTENTETNSSIVVCNQNELYEIVCEIIDDYNNDIECLHYLSLQCSMCHFHDSLGNSSSLSVMSPLYPVLQPNNICDYDIELDPEQYVAMTLEDLSLPGYQYSSGHDNHCFDSFVIVEIEKSGRRERLDKKCGSYQGVFQAIPKEAERLILSFVSGAAEDVRGSRGFNITLTSVPRSNVGAKQWMMVIYILVTLFFVVIFMLGGFIVLKKYHAKPCRNDDRRGSTWHGPRPVAGVSLHHQRTVSLGIQLDNNNIYTEDDMVQETVPSYSVPLRRGRSLPRTPDPGYLEMNRGVEHLRLDNNNLTTTAFKIYETLESVAESPSAPDRPAWTLQVPDQGIHDASPVYLPVEHGVKIETPVADQDKLRRRNTLGSVIDNNRKSLSDTAKKMIHKFSVSVSNNKGIHLIDEESDDSDDVFC